MYRGELKKKRKGTPAAPWGTRKCGIEGKRKSERRSRRRFDEKGSHLWGSGREQPTGAVVKKRQFTAARAKGGEKWLVWQWQGGLPV